MLKNVEKLRQTFFLNLAPINRDFPIPIVWCPKADYRCVTMIPLSALVPHSSRETAAVHLLENRKKIMLAFARSS